MRFLVDNALSAVVTAGLRDAGHNPPSGQELPGNHAPLVPIVDWIADQVDHVGDGHQPRSVFDRYHMAALSVTPVIPPLAALRYCRYAESMKAALRVSRRGGVTLPAKLRQALGIKTDDQLIAEATPEGLLLRPAVTLPIEIYSDKRIREFDEAEAELEKVIRRKKKARSAR